jgi:two-component system, sensor histidine kinase and response regulator
LTKRAFVRGHPFALIITDVHMPQMNGFELAEKLKQSPYRAEAIVLMLTSGERPGDIERAHQLGVSSYLLKPVRREELKEVIAKALGMQAAPPENGSASTPTRPALAATSRVSSSRVLVAEDNLVNQRLVQRVLEKEGHQVVVVGTGQEALEALKHHTFDLILMDVQMPYMDGLEASRAIRDGEALTNEHIPIIALTAHAMKGDRDKCLAAGMDAYLSKPVHPADLLNMVQIYGSKECVDLGV